MKRSRSFIAVPLGLVLCFLLSNVPVKAEDNFKTLLPSKILDSIIAHTSGDIAFQHIRRISLFNRLAASEAYHRAAEYVLGQVKKYGLAEAQIEQYPADGKTWYYMFQSFYGWDGESGVVWLTSPGLEKLCDFAEMPACLCRWSNSSHVSGELVYVGEGRPEDFKGIDVKNKVVLTSSDPRPSSTKKRFSTGAPWGSFPFSILVLWITRTLCKGAASATMKRARVENRLSPSRFLTEKVRSSSADSKPVRS